MSAWGIGRQAAQPSLARVDPNRKRRPRAPAKAELAVAPDQVVVAGGPQPEDRPPGGDGGDGNGEGQPDRLQTFIGTPVKWIPAEIVTLFTASIAAFVATDDDPAWVLFVLFLVLTPIAVIAGAFAQSGPSGITRKVLIAAGLALPAFAIWSFVVPDSGWKDITWVADHPALTTVIAAVAGYLYSLIAEGTIKATS